MLELDTISKEVALLSSNSLVNSKERGLSPAQVAWKRFKKNRLAMWAGGVIILLVLMAIAAPLIAPYPRDQGDLSKRFSKPSREHWLGTDDMGRDVLTRLIYGAQASLAVGLVSTGISIVIGVTLGAISGYFGGLVDNLIMRLVDIFMCFPFFLMAIVMAAVLGPGIRTVMLVSGVLSWPGLARIVRAEVLAIKEREFVEAARALGLSAPSIIWHHILPNVFAVLVVYATLGIAGGILGEAGLSYLGLGVKPPQPSWGNMLHMAQNFTALTNYPWLWIPAGIMNLLTVLSINVLGDGLRDALDPKLRQ
ncbi:MAG: ABC transporter permease [Firmicutes bacterium]|nr:ABC transporter permease [Bacillota bacterium]